jgi:uncharacterized protein
MQNFEKDTYINLETYRRSGEGMQTPVWFVKADGKLFVRTIANSGKVKRIRNNSCVRVAVCDARGGIQGEWVTGQAHVLAKEEVEKARQVNHLLNRKYGLLKAGFDLFGRIKGQANDTIEIWFSE